MEGEEVDTAPVDNFSDELCTVFGVVVVGHAVKGGIF